MGSNKGAAPDPKAATSSQKEGQAGTKSGGSSALKGSFLTPQLVDHINAKETVTTILAAHPDQSVEQAEESRYGKRHHTHKHFAKENEDEAEGLLEKLHLKKSHAEDDEGTVNLAEENHEKAMSQYEAIKPLTGEQMEELRGVDNFKWGTSKPSDLFMNVGLGDERLTGLELMMDGM